MQASVLSIQATTTSAARSTTTCSTRHAELFLCRQGAGLQVRAEPEDGWPWRRLPRRWLLLELRELRHLRRLWHLQVVCGYWHFAASAADVGTQTPGLGPYTLETAVSGRYAEYYGGWVWERCAMALWF